MYHNASGGRIAKQAAAENTHTSTQPSSQYQAQMHSRFPGHTAPKVPENAGNACNEYDVAELARVVDEIPPMQTLQQWAHSGCLVASLNGLHPLLYPLLRWLLSSNRSHLRKLEDHEKIKGVGTDDQYMLVTGPMERESQFQALKSRYGSLHVFHGSGIGNWHAILRTSLRNMSNSKYMSAGAAHGAGIYFAENQSTSMGYCTSRGVPQYVTSRSGGSANGWKHSRFYRSGAGTMCMALCEVVDNRPKFTHSNGGIFVVPQEEYVVTRYFLVNPSGNAHASKLKLPEI
jgi:hypothetical protein